MVPVWISVHMMARQHYESAAWKATKLLPAFCCLDTLILPNEAVVSFWLVGAETEVSEKVGMVNHFPHLLQCQCN